MKLRNIIIATILLITAASCNKEKDARIPPDVKFKTGAGYTDKDTTLNKGESIKVGIVATKTEDDLKSYNISYAYDGASTTSTFYNYSLQTSEYNNFAKDTTIVARNVSGTEKWIFTILDRDGNITQKSIVLTVK